MLWLARRAVGNVRILKLGTRAVRGMADDLTAVSATNKRVWIWKIVVVKRNSFYANKLSNFRITQITLIHVTFYAFFQRLTRIRH